MRVVKPKNCPKIPLALVGKCSQIIDFYQKGEKFGFLGVLKDLNCEIFVEVVRKNGKERLNKWYTGQYNKFNGCENFVKNKEL